jgi:signal transduction histidine kinase
LHDHHGHRIGTLCIIDRKPRSFAEEEKTILRDLANLVEREFSIGELRDYYDDRNRALNVLTEIAMDSSGDAAERATKALNIACEYLGLETGIVSQVTEHVYTVHWHYTRQVEQIENGTTLPVDQTYCSLLLESGDKLLAIEHMAESGFSDHPCYANFGLEAYLAAPIWIDGEIFGTVNFSSRSPRNRPFSATEEMFVTLFADWVADTLYRIQRTETLNKLVTQAPGMLYQYRLWPSGHSSFPYTSPGIQEIYGIDAEEAAIDAGKAIARVHPDDLPELFNSIKESAQTLSQWHLRYRVRLDTGGWSWVEGLAQPEALADGSILWHGYITNVDERQKIDEMKNQFISTVSHELRTPLTSISGSLGLILGGATGPISEKAERMLDIARRNTKQLRHLIDDLLDIEKLVSGNVTFDASVQRLDEAAEAAIEEIQPMARKRGVEVQLNALERDLYANYDIVRLTQAITNLLSNAIKFSPAGAAVMVDLSKSGDEAKLEIRDQGPGVPVSFRDRIFQKFAQANSTSSRAKEGTGLGLAITRELMQAMGGEVDFESEEGSGACFWITLPLAEPGTQ